jgi:hypothetical protein
MQFHTSLKGAVTIFYIYIYISYDPQIPFLDLYTTEIHAHVYWDLYKNIHSSIIHGSPKVEKT